jgi:hypothetical protein
LPDSRPERTRIVNDAVRFGIFERHAAGSLVRARYRAVPHTELSSSFLNGRTFVTSIVCIGNPQMDVLIDGKR